MKTKRLKRKFGLGEKVHVYFSGMLWLTVILAALIFIAYVLVKVAMMP